MKNLKNIFAFIVLASIISIIFISGWFDGDYSDSNLILAIGGASIGALIIIRQYNIFKKSEEEKKNHEKYTLLDFIISIFTSW